MPARRKARRGRSAGFTLVEVLVAGTLGLFVLLGMEVAWWNSTRVVQQATSQLDLQREAGVVLDAVGDAARKAATFTISDYATKTANLVIFRDGSGTELSRYFWEPTSGINKVYRSTAGGAASAYVNSTVQNLSFSASDKELTINLTVTDSNAQTASFTTTAWVRN